MNPRHRLAAAALLLPLAAAQAQVSNGNFATGLTGWATLGDASVQAGGPAGASQLWLTTASATFQDDFPAAAGARNRSGTSAADAAVPGGVEEFAGLNSGALDGAAYAYEGSVARQQFQAKAGDVLRFSWDLGSSDANGDIAFAVIDGQLSVLGVSAPTALAGTLGNTWRTGFTGFSVTFGSAGSHSLAFGVMDMGDYAVTSTLSVANVELVSAVPEPLGLLLAGAGALALRRTRRRLA